MKAISEMETKKNTVFVQTLKKISRNDYIRLLHRWDWSIRAIAQEYGMSRYYVEKILEGK